LGVSKVHMGMRLRAFGIRIQDEEWPHNEFGATSRPAQEQSGRLWAYTYSIRNFLKEYLEAGCDRYHGPPDFGARIIIPQDAGDKARLYSFSAFELTLLGRTGGDPSKSPGRPIWSACRINRPSPGTDTWAIYSIQSGRCRPSILASTGPRCHRSHDQ